MKKLQIGKRTKKIELLKEATMLALPALKEVYEAYNNLNIGEFDMVDIEGIYNKNEFVKDKIMQHSKNPEIHGIPVRNDELRKLIQLPENIELFNKAVDKFDAQRALFRRHALSVDFYKVENGDVLIDENKIAAFEEINTLYACHPKEHELYMAINTICDALNIGVSVINKYSGHPENFANHPGIMFENGIYLPDPEFIKHRCDMFVNPINR